MRRLLRPNVPWSWQADQLTAPRTHSQLLDATAQQHAARVVGSARPSKCVCARKCPPLAATPPWRARQRAFGVTLERLRQERSLVTCRDDNGLPPPPKRRPPRVSPGSLALFRRGTRALRVVAPFGAQSADRSRACVFVCFAWLRSPPVRLLRSHSRSVFGGRLLRLLRPYPLLCSSALHFGTTPCCSTACGLSVCCVLELRGQLRECSSVLLQWPTAQQ